MQSDDNLLDSASIARSVRDLMAKNGIPTRKQSKELSLILELSFSQAHRKLQGSSPWALDQLKKVTDHYKEPLSTLGMTFAYIETSPVKGEIQEAIFVIGQRELPCLAWVGSPLQTARHVEFVAIKNAGVWRVVETAAAPENAILYKVEKVEISMKQARVLSIAIIDDAKDSADNLRDYLNEIGFNASSFYDAATFQAAMQKTVFDGFVIDWLLGTHTAEPLIRLIRSSENALAPIFLLTGELLTGRADESEVARVILQFNVACQEKPTRLPIIAAELSKTLGLA